MIFGPETAILLGINPLFSLLWVHVVFGLLLLMCVCCSIFLLSEDQHFFFFWFFYQVYTWQKISCPALTWCDCVVLELSAMWLLEDILEGESDGLLLSQCTPPSCASCLLLVPRAASVKSSHTPQTWLPETKVGGCLQGRRPEKHTQVHLQPEDCSSAASNALYRHGLPLPLFVTVVYIMVCCGKQMCWASGPVVSRSEET